MIGSRGIEASFDRDVTRVSGRGTRCNHIKDMETSDIFFLFFDSLTWPWDFYIMIY